MKLNQVAAQLYTCRDSLKDVDQARKTLTRLRKIGYTAVQVSGVGVPYETLAPILADTGLTCCATHESSPVILDSPETVVERLRILDCSITAYPFPRDVDLSSRRSVDGLIAKLQHAGEVLARAGQTLCYHNHNMEFRTLDGKTILDLIYEGTSKSALQGEPDTYWIQYGGGDNIAWCRKLAGRLPIIHLKDYKTTAENAPIYCEIGAGVLDFKSIVAVADASGCKWFSVEQDICPGDPVDSLEESFRYIAENLVS